MSIECRLMTKGYKNKQLFKALTVTFEKNICNCIIGENGSGKTTLLKIIAGLEKADEGIVSREGTCTYSGSNPYMLRGTVLENIQYPFTLKRQMRSPEPKAILEMIERLGLKGLEHREAYSLSSGEKQKVALGRALVWQPNILLLDEPTANIDRDTIESIEQILLDYVKQPDHTLLLVSHDLEQAKRLSGKTWVLKEQTLLNQKGDL